MDFHEMVKGLRADLGVSLRRFCLGHNLDPSNWSKLERGVLAPPRDPEVLGRWADALGLKQGTEAWQEFMDASELARGQVPRDLLKKPDQRKQIFSFIRSLREEAETAKARPKPSAEKEAEKRYRPPTPSPVDDFID